MELRPAVLDAALLLLFASVLLTLAALVCPPLPAADLVVDAPALPAAAPETSDFPLVSLVSSASFS